MNVFELPGSNFRIMRNLLTISCLAALAMVAVSVMINPVVSPAPRFSVRPAPPTSVAVVSNPDELAHHGIQKGYFVVGTGFDLQETQPSRYRDVWYAIRIPYR